MIESYCDNDVATIINVFKDFEMVLGPLGAAKALHLLAPNFFPLWDRDIAKEGYGIYLKNRGLNANLYLSLMEGIKHQIYLLRQHQATEINLIKAIDEYNYCRYTKEWI